MVTWDARTQQTSRCTRVRRGDARGTPLLARRTASRFFFFSFRDTHQLASTRSRRELICAKLDWFAPIGAESAKYRCVSVGKRKSASEGKKKKNLKPKMPRCYRRHNLTPFFFFFFLFFAGAQRTFYSVLFLFVDKFCFCFFEKGC